VDYNAVVSEKHWYPLTCPHGVTTQKNNTDTSVIVEINRGTLVRGKFL
jgi:hypothetical protein